MSVPFTEYHGYQLRAYSRPTLPLTSDTLSPAEKRFSAVVSIAACASHGNEMRRYSAPLSGAQVGTPESAADAAMQYGRDIVDGKIQAREILSLRKRP